MHPLVPVTPPSLKLGEPDDPRTLLTTKTRRAKTGRTVTTTTQEETASVRVMNRGTRAKQNETGIDQMTEAHVGEVGLLIVHDIATIIGDATIHHVGEMIELSGIETQATGADGHVPATIAAKGHHPTNRIDLTRGGEWKLSAIVPGQYICCTLYNVYIAA